MTKQEIINRIFSKTGIEKNVISLVVEELMVSVKETLNEGEGVFLRGFGTFSIKHKAARYQNIKRGTETLYVPEHNEPSFKPCKEFREEVAKLPVK